ncbi:phosphoglucosamine mutase [Marinibactrum halimedae]|uniref:Phosphoglucosamine mutase n=1 Tax=Marinibactrum halimedae TaxID=1444977 RepID=A0AA37T4T7_9GAMM|nr:phosphoglucosamine mutase [Marinibactrum halimedae]MCD9459005.1 phosphoglucosamine mutase [Marinibactrum halimedae]GLS26865.1 phosphoglucosamine mutase [Marinibactrum halimedae]
MANKKVYFGTDGIRGKVGDKVINPEFMLRLGWAVGQVLAEEAVCEGGPRLILIGKDTRISGYMFESALQAGLISAGVDVGLLGPMPTPAIAYLTRTFQARAGIVISASHNPYFDNGVKFFNSMGGKLDDQLELAIERKLEESLTTVQSLGKARRINDAPGRYIEFCKGTLPIGFSLAGMKLVIDCANGATYHVAPSIFRELGADVVVMADQPDGLNINKECGSTHPTRLQARVIEERAGLGIAFDGDGDRVLMVDHKGELVDGDELLYIIAAFYKTLRGDCSGVVGTQMSNLGLELALGELNIPMVRAKVGDRYVIEAMSKNNWNIGGESSGHIICREVSTTGDGIVSALQVLRALVENGQSLHRAKQSMRKMPQTMINVRIKERVDIHSFQSVQAAVNSAEEQMGRKGRVLLRPSGTEPLIRVMVEGEDQILVREIAQSLADVVEKAVA